MLIDDNEADNYFHNLIIEEAGIAEKIEIAINGEEAINYLTREGQVPPDLIFLDINMPKMNGWEFLEEYNRLKIKKKGNIVIVMLTTSLNPEDRKRAEQYKDVSRFEVKPLNEKNILEIIEKHF